MLKQTGALYITTVGNHCHILFSVSLFSYLVSYFLYVCMYVCIERYFKNEVSQVTECCWVVAFPPLKKLPDFLEFVLFITHTY